MSDQTFARYKQRVAEALASLARSAEERDGAGTADAVRALEKKLADERFNVVVVGEFKRGKTTFVNALLGAEILPAAVVPLTSIVTAVTWGEEPRAEVLFTDGRVEEIPPESLHRYVTERENPQNELSVERATLYYPSEDLRDGVFLVDTPGVGSIYSHNTDAAYAFVPEADAALFLTSADPPISATEQIFLQDVRAEAARMFFILNKVDYLSERDRHEALVFTNDVLQRVIGHEVVVYPISARRALDAKVAVDPPSLEQSGFLAFEKDFRQFLLREKGETIIRSVATHALKVLADERNSLEIQERALQIPAQELGDRAREMEDVFAHALSSREDMYALLRNESDKLVKVVESDLAGFRQQATPPLMEAAERFLSAHTDLRSAPPGLDEEVKAQLRRFVDRWRAQEERKVTETFRTATQRFVNETNNLVERTVALCAQLLQVELESVEIPEGIGSESGFYYGFFDETPTLFQSLLPDVRSYMPKALQRKTLMKRMRERVPQMVDMYSGRMRWDFVQRLDKSKIELQRTLDRRLDETIDSLRRGVQRALEERASTAEEATRALDRLGDTREELTRIRSLLEEIRLEVLPSA